jgi:predicted transcriptional regulator
MPQHNLGNKSKPRLYKSFPTLRNSSLPTLSYIDFENEFFNGFSKLVKAFRINGKNKEIVELLLKNREGEGEGLTYKQIQNHLRIKELWIYLRRLKEKGLVEKIGNKWRITNFAYFFFAQAKSEKWKTREDLEDLKRRSLEFLGIRIAQSLSFTKLKQKAKLVKITYVYGSHNRKYLVKKSKANLREELEKVTKDLKDRFPNREYELVELPITASKVYVAKEKEKEYSIVFHHHQNTVDVFVDYFELKEKPSYILWILRTLLYKLRLLEKVEKKNG